MTPAPSTPVSPPESEPDRRAVLAASAPWLGALLNVLPGLGSGYIYQRRWRAYWITSALATAWFLLGALRADGGGADPDPAERAIGLAGLLALAAATAAEAFLAARRARMD